MLVFMSYLILQLFNFTTIKNSIFGHKTCHEDPYLPFHKCQCSPRGFFAHRQINHAVFLPSPKAMAGLYEANIDFITACGRP